MNTKTPTSFAFAGARFTRGFRFSWAASALVLALGFAGCFTKPVPVTDMPPAPPPPPVAIKFGTTGAEPLGDRSPRLPPQAIVDEANRVWGSRTTDMTNYLRSGRLLCSVLDAGEFATPEEAIRLSTMALQHALLADDTETLRSAAKHWESAYRGIHKALVGGEAETYLLALRRLGQDLPDDLLNIAHPEIRAVLNSET